MQPLSGEHVLFDPSSDRLEHGADCADGVGGGGQGHGHALEGVAFAKSVERLMRAELLVDEHGQQAGAGPASRDHVERRRCLADRLAVTTGKLLADGLHDLPLTWDHFERGGDVLPQLAKPGPAAALAGAGRIQHDPLTGQVLWEGGADLGPLAFKAFNRRGLGQRLLGSDLCFAGVDGQLLEGEGHLIGDESAALGLLAVDLPLELGDAQRLMGDQSLVVRGPGLGDGELSP